MGKEKLDKKVVKEYNTVEECLKAGYSWEKCVGVKIKDDGKLHGYITKACPRPMKTKIVEAVLSGEPINFTNEEPGDKKGE